MTENKWAWWRMEERTKNPAAPGHFLPPRGFNISDGFLGGQSPDVIANKKHLGSRELHPGTRTPTRTRHAPLR